MLGVSVTTASADDAAERKLFDDAARVIETVRKGDARITLTGVGEKPLAGFKVHARLRRHAFLFGGAIALRDDVNAERDKAYREAFARLFNYATTENIMKWKPIEPERGRYAWARPDATLDWCEKNDITLKSHCLIWGEPRQGAPKWLMHKTRDEVRALMKAHVDAVMTRYKGRIRYYDVINEPVHCHVFDEIAGIDHIEQVMHWAHAADRKAYLIINEYNLIASARDRRRFIKLLKDRRDRGMPLDGIGIQAHSPGTTWHSPKTIVTALDELATLGKDLHITELTLKTEGTDITGGYRKGKWTPEAQAEYYRQLYTLCFGHAKVKAITMWAVFDSRSWLAGGGIFDREGKPKAAATMLDDLLHETWHTDVTVTTDAGGRASLRGFKGDYDLEVRTPEGKPAWKVSRTLGAGDGGAWDIRIGATGAKKP